MILAPSQTVSRMKLCDLSKPVLPASESSGQVREDFDPLNMQQRNAPRWETSVELRRHGQPNRVDGIKTWISQTKPTKGRLASLLASSSFLLPLLLLLQAVTKVKLKFFFVVGMCINKPMPCRKTLQSPKLCYCYGTKVK